MADELVERMWARGSSSPHREGDLLFQVRRRPGSKYMGRSPEEKGGLIVFSHRAFHIFAALTDCSAETAQLLSDQLKIGFV